MMSKNIYREFTSAPKFKRRASPTITQTTDGRIKPLSSLGATSISQLVSLHRSLSGRSPRVAPSPQTTQLIPQRRARTGVQPAIDTRPIQPTRLGDPTNLSSFGQAIGSAKIFQKGGAFEFVGAFQEIGKNFSSGVRDFFGIPDQTG
jgi:hypothetical protein